MDELKRVYNEMANTIQGWKDMTTTDLCRKYCEAQDKGLWTADGYFSCIILRFWSQISKAYRENMTLNLYIEDYYQMLYEAILYACDPNQRVWDKKNVNAEQVINQVFRSHGINNAYASANAQKNLGKTTEASLDELAGVDEDGERDTIGNLLEDEDANIVLEEEHGVQDYVIEFIQEDKLVEALIFYLIGNKDTMLNGAFSMGKLESASRELNETDCKAFLKEYLVDEVTFRKVFDYYKGSSPKRRRTMVSKTLAYYRTKHGIAVA